MIHFNDAFFGLSANLSQALETDDIDLLDVHMLSPGISEAGFDAGVLLVGSPERAEKLRAELLAPALLPFEVINAFNKDGCKSLPMRSRETGGFGRYPPARRAHDENSHIRPYHELVGEIVMSIYNRL